MNFLNIANQYVDDITNDIIPACRLVKLAVARAHADHERGDDWPYYFDPRRAVAPCEFISRLKFPTDAISTSAGEKFVLRPDQIWHLTEIFGWVRQGTNERRFRRAFIEIPRGNGKSVESGALTLYIVCTATGGAQILCAASLREQARIVFDRAKEMCLQDADFREAYNLEVKANAIVQRHTGNILKLLPATSTSVEGTSPNFAILDELHAVRGRKLHSALLTGCAKKKNSLFLCVTTAGDDDSSVAYESHRYTEQILNGEISDDSYLGLIYTADPEIHWSDPLAWKQANPSLGISVDENSLASEAKTALQLPGEKLAFQSRHLNRWLANDFGVDFINASDISKCLDPKLQPEPHSTAHAGIDLASTKDLTTVVLAHPRYVDDKLHVSAFCKAWLPEATFTESQNAAYEKWRDSGEIEVTDGKTTNYKKLEEYVLSCYFTYELRSLSFDQLQSNYLMTRLGELTGNKDLVIGVPQSARQMTPGILLLQELITDGRLHTNSSLLIWCLKNLRTKHIGSSMIQPVRPRERTKKIDCAVALIMALNRIAASTDENYFSLPKTLSI
jgi:phage terminase large subunit-like protein